MFLVIAVAHCTGMRWAQAVQDRVKWRRADISKTAVSHLCVSALIPGQRTKYQSFYRNPVTEPYEASPPPNSDAVTRTDSGQPSQFILPPALTPRGYSQFTQAIPVSPPSTQFTRTYYGG